MKNKALSLSVFTLASMITMASTTVVYAKDGATEQSNVPNTETAKPANPEGSTGECWVWPGCIIIN